LLVIPDRLGETTSARLALPDSEVIYAAPAGDFDLQGFITQGGGRLSRYQEWLGSTGWTSGAAIVQRVAQENSINPRLLLALLQYQSGWVYGEPGNLAQDEYPLGLVDYDRRGLYRQLVWAVNQLSIGYYGWREGRLTSLQYPDGGGARLAPDLNAGTAALQYFFSRLYDKDGWTQALSLESGLPALYEQMFGNPWLRAQLIEPLFPAGLEQPVLILPFVREQVWAFTGGPHGAWEHDGAWAALDFAPASVQPGCFESFSWLTAAASGLVVRSERGVVVIDLDGDGDEHTGWVLLYLHVAEKLRVPAGTLVQQGERIGFPSCEGGVATGTHVHIARKYNGEWIPADGPLPFVLGGWRAHAGPAPYKGYLTRDDQTVQASDLGIYATRILRTPADP
jgi:murein DD-endopeptidase MepM/ murein hydrolase activator NlpD